jgi:hypothetical protein
LLVVSGWQAGVANADPPEFPPDVGWFPEASFVLLKHWVRDDAPGGNSDGQAGIGETVEPRFRIENQGGTVTNARIELEALSSDLTVVVDQITVGRWLFSQREQGGGLSLTVSPDATAEAASVRVRVVADQGEWSFDTSIPLLTDRPDFQLNTQWIRDPDRDGVAEPGETIEPRFRVENIGLGDATNASITLVLDDPELDLLTDTITIGLWPQGERMTAKGFQIAVAETVSTRSVAAQLQVNSSQGTWLIDTAIGLVAPPPDFSLATSWVKDPEPGGNLNRQAEPGEAIEPRIRLKNTGDGHAHNVTLTISTTDADISITQDTLAVALWQPGERRNDPGLLFTVAETATAHDAAFTTVVTSDEGTWTFDVSFPISAPLPDLDLLKHWENDFAPEGNFNRLVEPGELIGQRIRLVNVSQVDATGATITLSTTDADITMVQSELTVGVWAAGTRQQGSGLQYRVAEGATPHDVAFAVHVSANEASWDFTMTVAIVPNVPDFELLRNWVNDREPDGDFDRLAEPGELIDARFRLENTGLGDASDAVITLTITDPDVTVQQNQITVGTWAAGVRMQGSGLVFSVSGTAAAHDLTAQVTVTAAEGQWDFTATIPIGTGATAPAKLASPDTVVWRTELRPNYPNPFNPETWIPFALAHPSEVTLRLYDVSGRLVRRLRLGYREAGAYTSRSDAAHWDGRNDAGEAVASGMYYAEIQAGGDRDMRRMMLQK